MKTINLVIILNLFLLISCDKSTNPDENSSFWILQRDKQDDIAYYAIFFSDINNGWIVGYNGTIKNTTDGGNHWQTQKSSVTETLCDVNFINNLRGWICGWNNTILKTTNGGKSWIDLSPSHSENSIYVSVKFIDENIGWMTNSNGQILRTTDSGLTWEIKKSGGIGAFRLSVLNTETVFAFSGKFFRTYNCGESWDSVIVSVPQNYYASEIFFINPNKGWITAVDLTGETMITNCCILTTNDGGEVWSSSEIISDNGTGLRCIYFVNENVGWVAGPQNIYKTINGGKRWLLEFSPSDGKLYAKDMCFVDENNGWIINWEGKVYKHKNNSIN